MELNHTCLEILNLLHNEKTYISVKDLAVRTGKTERSVRYSLELIDRFLTQKGLPLLERKFGSGVLLEETAQTGAVMDQFLAHQTPYQYKFSSAEREQFLEVCLLVGRSRYVSILEMAQRLTVSYGTISTDLERVEQWMTARGLKLVRRSRMGLRAEGDETAIRRACLERLDETISLTEYENYLYQAPLKHKITGLILDELFQGLDRAFIRDLPKQAEAFLNRVFDDESFGNLIFFLAILAQRRLAEHAGKEEGSRREENGPHVEEAEAAVLLLDLLAENVGITYTTGDAQELTEQLLISKSIERGQGTLGRDPGRSRRFIAVAEEMVDKIEELYHISFGAARSDLVERLMTHMIPTVYRIRYHRKIVNPLYDELAAKHGELLRYTKEAAKPLERHCGAPVNDQEISYLALYFLAALDQQEGQRPRRPRVVVACGSGYGTAQVVASQLSRSFEIEIAAVLSGRNVLELTEQGELHYDYIVSTVDLPRLPEERYIKVNPIFTHADYEKIAHLMDVKKQERPPERYLETADTLARIAKKHGAATNLDQMKMEFLATMIQTSERSNFLDANTREPSLAELLLPKLVQMDVECRDWKEVVRKGTVPLEMYGYVAGRYKDAIIHNILEYGPAMVMFPGALISHAAPTEGCRKLGVSFMSLRRPVSFHNKRYDPVRIVFTLSVLDGNRHMNALMQLFRMLSDPDIREQLFQACTKEQLLKLIQRASEG